MTAPLVKILLFAIGYSACSDASESRPITPSSDPMDSLFGRLLDPQKVEIWHITPDPSLEGHQEHMDMFDLPYEPRPWKGILGPQRDNVMALVKQADWDHSSIWKQKRSGRTNYVICYHRQSAPDVTFWAIGTEKKLLWSAQKNKNTFQLPEPSTVFPKLTNDDPLWELHGKYKEMKDENEKLIASNQKLEKNVDQKNAENQGRTVENDKLRLDTERVNESLRTEQEAHESLKENHQQMMMIGGAVGLGLVFVIVVLVVVICCMRRRKKDCSIRDLEAVVPKVQQRNDRRTPILRSRSQTLQFGMNEIFKVTPRNEGDLVKIARPLETASGERRLSEELFGIKPIISNHNEPRKNGTAFVGKE